jgi:hypothetical protein
MENGVSAMTEYHKIETLYERDPKTIKGAMADRSKSAVTMALAAIITFRVALRVMIETT